MSIPERHRNDGSIDWTKPADLVLTSKGHPEANKRSPQPGDVQWRLRFILDDDRTVDILLGEDDMNSLERMILQSRTDSALEEIGVNPL